MKKEGSRKALAALVCGSMLTVALVGGTLAYLADTDSDVNVMTLGNVAIEQIEQQLAEDGVTLEPFEQGKGLYPGTEISKIVSVKNTGKSDVYFRTLIAFEDVDSKTFGVDFPIGEFSGYTWSWGAEATIEIDGVTYQVYEAVYNSALKAGEESPASLTRVEFAPTCTNEDMKLLGDTYDILVLSQAVQVEGFADAKTALDTAFGKTSEKADEWFGGMGIPTLLASGTEVNESTTKSGAFTLNEDIKTSDYGDDSRYGYGYEYIVRNGADFTLDLNGKSLVHDTVNENANKNAFTYLLVANHAGTKLTINGSGSVHSHNSEGYACAVQGKDGTLVTINGGDFEVTNGIAVWAGAGSHVVINGGSFVNLGAKTNHELIYSSGGVIDIYGGFFHNTDGNYTLNVEDRNRATGFINVYGGTYVNFDPSTGGQDPNNIKVADGYKVVSETQANGEVWYTVVPK